MNIITKPKCPQCETINNATVRISSDTIECTKCGFNIETKQTTIQDLRDNQTATVNCLAEFARLIKSEK